MKILIDTNVMLDFVLNRNQWQAARAIFKANDVGRIQSFITASSFTDTYFMAQSGLKKQTGHKNPAQMRQLVADWLQRFGILETNHRILRGAYQLNGHDFEDDVQIASAIAFKIDFIVTSDKKGFRQSPVAVVSPADFVANYL